MVVAFFGLAAPKDAGSSPSNTIVALNRALRLRKNREFRQVRQQGRSITSRLLTLTWTPNDVARLRIGFIVSKHISKHAVTRNRIKRLLSEAIRPALSELPSGWDIVLSARAAAITADVHMFEQDIGTLLRRARLLP
jgi:ribonuclease P protein component